MPIGTDFFLVTMFVICIINMAIILYAINSTQIHLLV